jgi:hypothetical protein
MSDVTLRRYRLDSNKESGWAIIVIGSDGYFSAVSYHGNFSYIWSQPGREFRQFLTECDPCYFRSKITHCRESEVWDQDQVEKNIRKELATMVAAGHMTQDAADLAFDECEGNMGSGDALWSWAAEVSLPEEFNLYEGIAATMPEPWSHAFATRVLPRFQALLRDELATEAAQVSSAAPKEKT